MTRSILIAIPTLNEARTIEGVIASLSADLPPDVAASFVLADGGGTDGTTDLVRRIATGRPDVLLLHNPQRVQSAAVNLAARTFGRGVEILIRCDAHAIYPPGYVRRLIEALDRTGADSVVVPMDSIGESCFQKAVAWVSDTPVGSGGSAHRGGRRSGFVDHGHHAAFRMAIFRRAGGYNETFTHNEDAEFDCRQRALGAKVYLDSDISCWSPPAGHPRWSVATVFRLRLRAFSHGTTPTMVHKGATVGCTYPFNGLGMGANPGCVVAHPPDVARLLPRCPGYHVPCFGFASPLALRATR